MIKAIQLKKFKCYNNSGKILFSRINILSGQNGRGKSTVLQSLLALAQSVDHTGIHQLNLNGSNVQLGVFDDVLKRKSRQRTLSIYVTTDDVVESELKFEFVPAGYNDAIAKIDHLFVDGRDFVEDEELVTSDGDRLITKDGMQLIVRNLLATSDIVGLSSLRQISYISADRIGPVNTTELTSGNSINSVGVKGEFVLNVLERRGKDLQEQVRAALSDILDGASLKVFSDGNKVIMRMDSSDKGAFFKPTNVGYGYGYLLSIVTSAISANGKSILIIENPEAHLHPGAQSRLMSFLCNIVKVKGMQLFIETHSDHIINSTMVAVKQKKISAKDVSVLFFEKNERDSIGVHRLAVTKEGRIPYPPTGFFDQIDNDLKIIVGF